MISSLENDGFARVLDVLSPAAVSDLIDTVSTYCDQLQAETGKPVHAVRRLFEALPSLTDLVGSPEIRGLVEPVLGAKCFAVRGIYFDKPPGSNWKVPWHQDQAIAVRQRIDVDEFGPWSVKEGVQHVEPPIPVLEKMLTVRLHLDDCDENNGPLRVIPGSHKLGRLTPENANRLKADCGEVTCTIDAGGVIMMRPLLLHASSPATIPSHRRVIHMEFASRELPGGLEWAEPIRPN